MRMILMFDMPVDTIADRRAYRQFRQFLLSEGFIMHQYSVYSKLLLNGTANTAMIGRLEEHNPVKGKISVLTVTEKQFSRMLYLSGSQNTSVANSDQRLVFLGETIKMNLNFHLLDEKISFEDAKILVIEDCRVFAELVKECYYYSGEGKVKLFDSKQTLLKPAEILLVSDLLSFDLNSATVW